MAPRKTPATKELPPKQPTREETERVKGGRSRQDRLATNHNQTLR